MRKISVKIAGAFVAFAFAFSASTALALTQAQIDSITSLLQSFGADAQTVANVKATLSGNPVSGGGSTSTGSSSAACGPWSRDLTVGATGSDVTNLQNFLISMGHSIPAGATGYFGSQTQSALSGYQSSMGISPAVGYFGPITKASVMNSCGGSTTPGTPTTPTTPAGLSGGAGSIENADFVSGLNNEKVGEDEDDVEVAGLRIEADDNSDIEIVAVEVNFDKTASGNSDFHKYADNVSIWLDGEKFAELDADKFEDDDNYNRTITLDKGAIIRSGKKKDLTVAITGISNLDSADAGDGWNVSFPSIRFRDGSGAVITDTTTDDIGETDDDTTTDSDERGFTFETFATASDAKLKASLSDDNPESTVVNVDDTNDTDGVVLLRFELEAEGDSDLRLRDLPITLTVTGATDIDALANTVYATIDGEEFSENLSTSSASASTTFSDFDYTLSAGETVEVVIAVDLNDTATSGFDEGDTIKAEFTASNRNVFDVEDESGEDLVAGDRTGTALGEAMALYDVAPVIELVSVDTKVVAGGSNTYDDTGTFTIKYKVTAVDGDIYVSDTATITTATTAASSSASNIVSYYVDKSGTVTTGDITAAVTFVKNGNNVTDTGVTNGVKVTDGSTGTFTLTIERTNNNVGDSGLFRAAVRGISWATTDAAAQNVYTFNLDEYESDYISIN